MIVISMADNNIIHCSQLLSQVVENNNRYHINLSDRLANVNYHHSFHL